MGITANTHAVPCRVYRSVYGQAGLAANLSNTMNKLIFAAIIAALLATKCSHETNTNEVTYYCNQADLDLDTIQHSWHPNCLYVREKHFFDQQRITHALSSADRDTFEAAHPQACRVWTGDADRAKSLLTHTIPETICR